MQRAVISEEEEKAVAQEIARLSTQEITAAVRAAKAPAIVKRAIQALAAKPSSRLGEILATFDARIATGGLGRAAREVVSRLGAKIDVTGECPPKGPVLIITNHPGAYDALALMGSLGERNDARLVASDRAFLRAMPHLSLDHLIFIAEDHPMSRARGVVRALDWIGEGHVLVHFGAGKIEPDVKFAYTGEALGEWGDGTTLLAKRAHAKGAAVVPCFISGVHSPRAKDLFFVKWAEARGITTIAPLVQATMSGYRDVEVNIRFGRPIEGTPTTPAIRAAVLKLAANAR
jgi:hypothetical protein